MPRLLKFSRGATDGKPASRSPLPLAVLEFESPSAAIIASPVPALARAINLLVFLLVVSVLVASALIRADKIVSAKGKLIADAPNIVMQPFDQSVVESIDVRKGSIVRKGQVLARLNPTFTAADRAAMKDQVDLLGARAADTDYVPEVSNSHAALQASILELRTGEYKSSLQAYDKRIDELQTQIVGDNAQAGYFRERLGIAADIESMRAKLLALQVDSRYNQLLAADVRLGMAASLTRAESNARRRAASWAVRKPSAKPSWSTGTAKSRKISPIRAANWWTPGSAMPRQICATNSWC